MSRTIRSLTIAGAALLAAAGAARAAEAPKDKSPGSRDAVAGAFQRVDADGDGKITEKEILAEAKRSFRRMDTDGSGDVSAAEFARARSGRSAKAAAKVKPAPANCPACAMGLTAEKVFSRLDADGDGKVTAKEFARSPGMGDEAEARAAVGRIDTDGDGSLSRAELTKAYNQRHANCPKVDPSKAGAGPDGRGNRSRFAMVFMMRSDKNGDGVVDKSEFRGSDARFDQMDKNANGKLEPDELADLHTRRMNDPKSMRERLSSGDLPHRPPSKRRDAPDRPKDPPKPNADR